MMKQAMALILALVGTLTGGCASSHSHAPAGWTAYGDSEVIMEETVSMGSLKGEERGVAIAGTITEVCLIKGCWMNVKDADGTEMFVQFENYGFFVPMNAAGRQVKAHGRAVKQEWSVEELRHFAEDAHKSAAEIAAINQPKVRVTFMADSIWVQGPGLNEPYAKH